MSRQSRLAEQIRREISNVVQLEIRDPRLGMVTITAVELSRDYSVAKVFFTVFEDDKKNDSQKVLEGSAGFLRKHIAALISMRITPRLVFVYDESIERGRHLSALIDNARAKDEHDRDHSEDEISENPSAETP